MFVSRIFLSGLQKYQYSFQLSCFRCYTSDASWSPSIKIHENNLNSTSNDQKSAIDTSNQNEWLWGYLRDRKKFSDLSEAQRR
ncbi:unnamed protein product, partial [Rotaria magnacalcarata]